MRVRDWQDIVEDVVESDADAEGWRALAGDRATGVGEDMFIGHPRVGVFQLKTYAKNPFDVRGVGTRVARKIDDDLDPLFPTDEAGRFAVRSPPENEDDAKEKAKHVGEVIEAHSDAPTTPADLFDDVMGALDSPAFGPMEFDNYGRPEGLDELSTTFEEAQDVLDAELDDIIDEDNVGKGFQ
jgi:hypothetical protein